MASVDGVLRRAMSAGLSPRRQLAGSLVGVAGLVVLTLGLIPLRDDLAVESILLLYLLAVVATAAVGGVWPASAAAILALGLVNWFFTPPYTRSRSPTGTTSWRCWSSWSSPPSSPST